LGAARGIRRPARQSRAETGQATCHLKPLLEMTFFSIRPSRMRHSWGGMTPFVGVYPATQHACQAPWHSFCQVSHASRKHTSVLESRAHLAQTDTSNTALRRVHVALTSASCDEHISARSPFESDAVRASAESEAAGGVVSARRTPFSLRGILQGSTVVRLSLSLPTNSRIPSPQKRQ